MRDSFQIITINPGSTSTKVAVFDDEKKRFSVNIAHSAQELSRFPEIVDQLAYRRETILDALNEKEVELERTTAFSGRCTGLLPMEGGVYEVNDLMYLHGSMGIGSRHPGNLGPMLARDFARQYGGRSFVVNPSSVDEFCPEARLTGLKEIMRVSRGHPLNQKEVARRYASQIGKRYEEINVVVVHMGGGISVTAHEKGRMVDTVDSTRGEGRMAPTRTGNLPAASLVELCFSGKYTRDELLDKIMKTGGWTDLLGTADAIEVERRIAEGDEYAKLVYETTAYQIAKDIGACAAALSGKVDAILLTGGLAHAQRLVELITERVSFIAPVHIFPGEYEMEGLAMGALRVLRGEEEPRIYTGAGRITS
ncbi:MAG: butyrate kinase [Lachnospiraceae bacterium]|nr:butyrate kinase [Lachnospiraceae bacterium]